MGTQSGRNAVPRLFSSRTDCCVIAHGDIFDLPAGAAHLLPLLSIKPGFHTRGRNGLALQFHQEVTAGLERCGY